eukprot:3332487-Heterocapsa_arctica.AAC.1
MFPGATLSEVPLRRNPTHLMIHGPIQEADEEVKEEGGTEQISGSEHIHTAQELGSPQEGQDSEAASSVSNQGEQDVDSHPTPRPRAPQILIEDDTEVVQGRTERATAPCPGGNATQPTADPVEDSRPQEVQGAGEPPTPQILIDDDSEGEPVGRDWFTPSVTIGSEDEPE